MIGKKQNHKSFFEYFVPWLISIALISVINGCASTEKPVQIFPREDTFSAYSNGVIFDKKTNLEWIAGPDTRTNWDQAFSWVQSLHIGGGGWRMPTRKEIETLFKCVDSRTSGITKRIKLFKTTGRFIWAGETRKDASAVYLSCCQDCMTYYFSFYSYRAFAVRYKPDPFK